MSEENQSDKVGEAKKAKRGQKAIDESDEVGEVAVQKRKFVLLKNHGLSPDGKTHQFFQAGTEFDPTKDKALIAKLAQAGAKLEEK